MIAMRATDIWQAGDAVINAWLHIPHSFSAEVISRIGFDSVTCDMQHGLIDYASLVTMLTSISTTTATPIVRVPALDAGLIGRVLDAGALGVICPMINSAADAKKLVEACRYAPLGSRSFGPNRAGFLSSSYAQEANKVIVPFAMIESTKALENLDEILAVDGLRAIYVGPADLALSMGYTPKADPTEIALKNAIKHVVGRARKLGVIAGIHTGSADGALAMISSGYQFVTLPSDRIMMETSARKMFEDVRLGQGRHATSNLASDEFYS